MWNTHFPHMGSAQHKAAMCPTPWSLSEGPGQVGTEATYSPLELCCWCRSSRTCARLLWWLTPPSLPLPRAGIAHQLTNLTRKEQNWMQTWHGWLHAKAGFSLAWRQICVDITKGSCVPFSHSPAMEPTSAWKTWDYSCCLVTQLKIFQFSSGVLEDMCMCVRETKHRQMWPF